MSETAKREFDEANPAWEPEMEYNMYFLRCQQDYFNHKLQARGHVFLNEVYDALGFERTREGALSGWVLMPDNKNFVSFGLPTELKPTDRSITLDFNIDGEIIDHI